LDKIRTKLPGAAVRTSLIVGFPGEGRKEFAGLGRFVKAARFDHVGVFTYSPEKGTTSFNLPDNVGPEEKENRRRAIMDIQAGLSFARNERRLGQTIEVLVDSRDVGKHGRYTGRSRFQAPEVDGIVRFSLPAGMAVPPSPIVRVEITSTDAYDLAGRLVP
jgi:ribosomal protein S12 methylthiotransferase